MGYSIAATARNIRLQQKMLNFMSKEYRSHWEISSKVEQPCYSSAPTSDLSYIKGKNLIGLDYNSGCPGFERSYAYTLVKWMTLKVGKTRKSFKEFTFDYPVPYMLVDDEEEFWPVLIEPKHNFPENIRWACCDQYGVTKHCPLDLIFELDQEVTLETKKLACQKHNVVYAEWSNESQNVKEAIHETWVKLLWPKIQLILKPIRIEMQRLDQIWDKL